MGWNAWGRYFVELLLCLPAGFLCLAPVKGRLRVSMGTFLWAAVGSITAFAAVGALVIMLTGWPENALLVPGLLLFFWLYCRLTEVEPLPAVFIFLLAAAVMGFCAVITDVLMAQVEVANPGTVPTLIAAGLQLALGMLTAALMWPLMASRVGWLVEHFMQASVWRIVWVLPLAYMLLFIAMMPEDYHTILVNRVQPLGAIILVFLLGLMAFLIELFYRIARSITDSAALREENHFLAAQASQYALLSGYIRETRRLRHDFRQHLRVLSGLAAKGDAAALTAYLKEVGGEEHEEIRFVFANPSLNALAGSGRIHISVYMYDVPIVKAAHYMYDCIYVPNVRQKFVPKALTLGSTPHQTGNIDKFDNCGRIFLRIVHFGKGVQPGIRHCDHTYIGVDSTKRIVG